MGAAIGKKGAPISEINVTPFVDVMLVMLIIFMVAAPMLSQGIDVDLPQTRVVKNLPTEKDYLVMSVDAKGTIYLDTQKIEFAEAKSWVEKLVVQQHKQLFLKADKNVPYGTVVALMGEIKAAGLDKVNVFAEQTKDEKSKQ